MKHSLAVSPDQITTNFLSNLSFFQNYKEAGSLFGVTGTLGSESERKMLNCAYSVVTADIPEFQEKRHHALQNITIGNVDGWKEAIISSAISNATLGRAVLVTCQSIHEAGEFVETLRNRLKDDKVNVSAYTRSDMPSEMGLADNKHKGGDIIVATTLAGRGMDLDLEDEVKAAGGLHVILTFFPTSLRVEHQAIGRASRNGQLGSSQMIILSSGKLVDFSPNYYQYKNSHCDIILQNIS